mgnify:CR=1 FL=1
MVQIVTDSSTLFTVEEAREMGVDLTPLCVSIGDLEGRDIQIDMDEFYKRISMGQVPTSSQPPIGEVVEMYERYPDAEIINIAIADGLSGTYQSACSAKEMVKHIDNITVFNTKTLCGPQRYMVLKAQQMKEEGKTAQEIMEWLEASIQKTESFLIPQDFGFLRRGGRLTPVAAALGSALKLKPIMTLTENGDKLDIFSIKRTMKSAVGAVISHLQKRDLDDRHILYISHANAPEDAENVRALLAEAFPKLELEILELGAVFVTQGGPKCVAIQYIEK